MSSTPLRIQCRLSTGMAHANFSSRAVARLNSGQQIAPSVKMINVGHLQNVFLKKIAKKIIKIYIYDMECNII